MSDGKFVAYLRVAADGQDRSGLDLDAQRKAVADSLKGGRWTQVAEYTEAEGDRRGDRPALTKALAACRRHGATLVIARLDRLSHDAQFLSSLQGAG